MNTPQLLAWAALPVTTLGVVLLPLIPAIKEWWTPSDTRPLHIDASDALDPTFMARGFAARLADAVAKGERKLGASKLMAVPVTGYWPLKDEEWQRGRSQHVWHATGDALLPDNIHFLGEVAAPGVLETATGCVYRALWAGQRLRLAEHGSVLRWAHGQTVEVGSGCRLAGRVSADESIVVWGRSFFLLLHAPTITFGTRPGTPRVALAAGRRQERGGMPHEVSWDPVSGRGTCGHDLVVPEWSSWRGDLVGRGSLQLGTGTHAEGGLKAHGDLEVGEHCRVAGSVFGERRVTIGAHAQIAGSVVAEEAIVLEAGCVIGAPGKPATVSAPRVEIAAGVTVHGTVWAGERGQTRHDTPTQYDTGHVPQRAPRASERVPA